VEETLSTVSRLGRCEIAQYHQGHATTTNNKRFSSPFTDKGTGDIKLEMYVHYTTTDVYLLYTQCGVL
jgi:hypothetical protein